METLPQTRQSFVSMAILIAKESWQTRLPTMGMYHILFTNPCVSENFDFQGFWPLRIMLLWTCNKKFVQLSASCSLGFKSRCRVAESHGHSMVSDLRSNRQVFYNNVSIYISSSIGTQVLPQFFDNICFYFLVLTIAILLSMNGGSLQFPDALLQWLAMVDIPLCAL